MYSPGLNKVHKNAHITNSKKKQILLFLYFISLKQSVAKQQHNIKEDWFNFSELGREH